jgi:glycosyltransferase involved in cell wall biosynthesis
VETLAGLHDDRQVFAQERLHSGRGHHANSSKPRLIYCVEQFGTEHAMSIAVVILTFNEEANLPAAIDSVCGWASEIFVVDSYSTDRTVEIARQRASDGVTVVQHEFEDFGKQWNWALTNLLIGSAWTLKLDADERATECFKQEVSALIATAPADLEAVYFRRTFHFMGKPLRWGGVSGNYVMHLWRTGKAIFEDRAVNEHALVRGRTKQIRAAIEHHDFKSISHWIDKHNRYSSLEAISSIEGNLTGGISPRFFGSPDERRMWLRRAFWNAPFRHVGYFLYRFVALGGFLDGWPGFRYCFLHAAYRYWTELKILEHRLRGNMPEVIWPQRDATHAAPINSPRQRYVDSRSAAA